MSYFYRNLAIEIAVALIIIVALVGGMVFFRFRISDAVAKISAVREELSNRSQSLQSFSVIKSQYEDKGRNYLNVLHNVVPAKDQLIDLRQEFQSLATRENIGFGFSFSAGDEAAGGSELDSLNFNLNVKGTIDELLAFMRDLQNFRYLITLDELAMTRQGSEIQMIIKGQIYYRPS